MITIGVKIKGLDKLQKELKSIQRNAKKLQGSRRISFDELFTPQFMSKYTDFSSFEELLDAGGFKVESQADFENIPDDVFDAHIAKHTRFDKWESMLDKATVEYTAKQLG